MLSRSRIVPICWQWACVRVDVRDCVHGRVAVCDDGARTFVFVFIMATTGMWCDMTRFCVPSLCALVIVVRFARVSLGRLWRNKGFRQTCRNRNEFQMGQIPRVFVRLDFRSARMSATCAMCVFRVERFHHSTRRLPDVTMNTMYRKSRNDVEIWLDVNCARACKRPLPSFASTDKGNWSIRCL